MIQIDMEMPGSCIECPIFDGEYGYCELNTDIDINWHGRPDNCPLHEVVTDEDTVSRPQEQRYGYWMRMSDLNESEDDRYKCSCCGNVVHHRDKVFLYTYNSWCGACGADMISKDAHGTWRRHATKGGSV